MTTLIHVGYSCLLCGNERTVTVPQGTSIPHQAPCVRCGGYMFAISIETQRRIDQSDRDAARADYYANRPKLGRPLGSTKNTLAVA